MGGKKKYINIFGSFTEPFNCFTQFITEKLVIFQYLFDQIADLKLAPFLN